MGGWVREERVIMRVQSERQPSCSDGYRTCECEVNVKGHPPLLGLQKAGIGKCVSSYRVHVRFQGL